MTYFFTALYEYQIHELTQQQNSTISKVVPWFLDNMPVSEKAKG
jgi:hypothetical protein